MKLNRRMATQTLEKHRKSAKGTGWDLGRTNRTGKQRTFHHRGHMDMEKYKALAATTEEEKNPGETHKLHIGTQVACSSEKVMFCTSCNKLHVKEKEKWEGRQTGCIDL